MMSSNGNIFHITGLCEGNLLVTSGSPSQRPVTRNFDVFFDLHLNKQLSKQSRHWRVKMPSCSLWCHCNANKHQAIIHQTADPITFKCMIILNVCLMLQLLNKNKKLSKKNGCWWTQCLSIWGMVISSKQYGLRLVLWVVWYIIKYTMLQPLNNVWEVGSSFFFCYWWVHLLTGITLYVIQVSSW